MSILALLQNHYHNALTHHHRLGSLPHIEKDQWAAMDANQAHHLLNWVVSQKWECKQMVFYEWVCGLSSPALEVLAKIVEHGYGLHYSVAASDENKVVVAHACAVGMRAKKLSKEFQSYVVQAATEGDPLLLAMDFSQWMGDFAIVDMVLKRINGVDESELECSSVETLAWNLMEALEDDYVTDQQYCQWLQFNSTQPWAPKMLAAAARCMWYWGNSPHSSHSTDSVQRLHERSRQFLLGYSQNVIEQTIDEAKKQNDESKYLDSVVPLLSETIQKSVINDPFFNGQPYTHQLRFQQKLKSSVDSFGVNPTPRKL